MRYVILKDSISKLEIESRKNYIERATNLYFIYHPIKEGIEFISIPSSSIDCLFIVGHNMSVSKYIHSHNICEKYIAIVSCKFPINIKKMKSKRIYISYDEEGKTDFYDGTDWNLKFNVSKEELKIINSKYQFIERVKKYFRRIK